MKLRLLIIAACMIFCAAATAQEQEKLITPNETFLFESRDDVEKTCQKGYTDSCIEAYSDYEEQSEEIDETYSEHFQHDTRKVSRQKVSYVGNCSLGILFVLVRNKGSYHLAEQVAVLYKEETDENDRENSYTDA